MSATEMNDLKMDQKCDFRTCDTLASLIESGKIKHPKDLTDADLIGIIDQLFRYFMTFASGQSLSETYLNFVYFYDPVFVSQTN